jgi:dTDP-glucose 4,6-dehydratase/UDP-glucuronate decarboxylase
MMDPHLARDAADILNNLAEKSQRFAGKTILLTGAAGFLGAQFIHYFLNRNDRCQPGAPCQVVAVDNFLRGVPPWLEALRERPDLTLLERDIVEPWDYGQVDFIIHAASIASPIYYRRHPIATMDANVMGLRHLLDHACRRPVESFLFFSSSEIYGDPDPAHIPTAEDYRGWVSCTGPRACYDESKRYGETLCVNFQRVHGVPVKIVRPFNNYGPGLKISDRRVLPDFFRDVLAGRNIVLLSDGRATRTFCYISDAITGYLLALLSSYQGESFNIGSDKPEISMADLARLVIEVTGKPLQVEFRVDQDPNYLEDNPQRRCPDLTKARKLLGYQPRVDLREGLERLYAYYQDHPTGSDR